MNCIRFLYLFDTNVKRCSNRDFVVSDRFATPSHSVKNTHANRKKKLKVQNHIAVTSRMVLFYFNFRGFAKRLQRTLLFGSRCDVSTFTTQQPFVIKYNNVYHNVFISMISMNMPISLFSIVQHSYFVFFTLRH